MPGILKDQADKAINRYMNRATSSTISDVDAVVFVVGKIMDGWSEWYYEFKRANYPVI